MIRALEKDVELVARSAFVRKEEVVVRAANVEMVEKAEGPQQLKAKFAHLIYTWLYSHSLSDLSMRDDPSPSREMLQELVASVPHTREIDWSWQVRSRAKNGDIVASSGNQIAELAAGEYIFVPGMERQSGCIGISKWSIGYDDGGDWLFVRCGRPGIARSPSEIRLYLNVGAEGATSVVPSAINALEEWGIPFVLKCHTNSRNYRRRDAVVIYLDRRELYVAFEAIASSYRSYAKSLSSDVPMFTLPLLPGLGLAETPPDGGSFGLARSLLCAEALIGAGLDADLGTRVRTLETAFFRAGLSTSEPFRNPGDKYEYDHARLSDIAKGAWP